jgi:hypothetical protein
MNSIHIQPRHLVIVLFLAPVLALAGYVTCMVAFAVIREVVANVVRAVGG